MTWTDLRLILIVLSVVVSLYVLRALFLVFA